MTVKVNMFVEEGNQKLVTLQVTQNNSDFFITKMIDVTDGKTKQQYITDAYNAALSEINAWKDDIETVGKEYNPATGTLENA